MEYAQYGNRTYQKRFTGSEQVVNYRTWIDMIKWGAFVKATYESDDDRFSASVGLRTDANNYSSEMRDLSEQLSPRLSVSYQLSKGLFLSGSIGLYYQLPAYTMLGFKDNNG